MVWLLSLLFTILLLYFTTLHIEICLPFHFSGNSLSVILFILVLTGIFLATVLLIVMSIKYQHSRRDVVGRQESRTEKSLRYRKILDIVVYLVYTTGVDLTLIMLSENIGQFTCITIFDSMLFLRSISDVIQRTFATKSFKGIVSKKQNNHPCKT